MLIDEIIALLATGEGDNTTEALLKTKIFLHQIGKRELVTWVNNELNGYSNESDVPPYRILPSQVLANVSNMAWQATSHPIPLGHLKEANRESLTISKMTQSLATLQELVQKNGHIIRQIPMELNSALERGLANGFRIQRAWCEISVYDIKGVIVNVRSRLLDFLLALKENIGDLTSETELTAKVRSFDATNLFNNVIFGDHTTVVVGERNVQTVSYNTGNDQSREALRILTEAIRSATTLTDTQKSELVEQVAFLDEQAVAKAQDRKPGLIRATFGALTQAAGTVTAISEAWQTAEPILKNLFGL